MARNKQKDVRRKNGGSHFSALHLSVIVKAGLGLSRQREKHRAFDQ
jgi:hypothetical protein